MKKKRIAIIIIPILLILAGCICYLFLKPETQEEKEQRELAERISNSKQEYDNFIDEKDKEAQKQLDLLDKGYDVSTRSYFSSPENIKLKYNLEQKGYKFNTITVKNENSTYFSNNNYSISCIIDINTNNIISMSFWNKSLEGDACEILNKTEEKQNQYVSYLQWLKENNLTLEQLKSVLLDYYLDNK